MMPATPAPPPLHHTDRHRNRLLAAMDDVGCRRLADELELVELPLGEVLAQPRQALTHVYFPTTAIVSLLYVTETGEAAQVAVVGDEGVAGIADFLGAGSTMGRMVVQSAGHGFRLRASSLKNEFDRAGSVMHLLLRYTCALASQMAQTALCNRYHSLHQQLCRWLLMSLDRQPGNELMLTHARLAAMHGVRRESVSEAAHRLQQHGVIRYARGHIEVLDRLALEARSCECYHVVRDQYQRLLPALRQKH